MAALEYRGRTITESDIGFIKQLITEHPQASRNALSIKLCEAWGWTQPNGQLKDMVCRSLMLKLHRADLIELPPPRFEAVNNVIERRSKRQSFLIDSNLFSGKLSTIGAIEFRQVRRSGYEEQLFESLIEEHHYLGGVRAVGEHLKYLVCANQRPIACFVWGSAYRRLGIRDRFIGWSAEARQHNLHYLVQYAFFNSALGISSTPCLTPPGQDG